MRRAKQKPQLPGGAKLGSLMAIPGGGRDAVNAFARSGEGALLFKQRGAESVGSNKKPVEDGLSQRLTPHHSTTSFYEARNRPRRAKIMPQGSPCRQQLVINEVYPVQRSTGTQIVISSAETVTALGEAMAYAGRCSDAVVIGSLPFSCPKATN